MPHATPRELLDFIAEHETLEATRDHFHLTGEELRQALRAITAAHADGAREGKAPLRRLKVYCDGASRGNPGLAGAGSVLVDEKGHVVDRVGKFLGRATNNFAEYQGLLLGLRRARQLGAGEVEIVADSELLVRQLKGVYKVRNPTLRELHDEANTLLAEFDRWTVRHVYREQNTEADEMSNRAIDEKM